MNIRVIIVTEGGVNSGFGHITRCTSLYQAFEDQGVLPEFIVNGDETVKELLAGLNFKILNWLKDRGSFLNLLQTIDIVVIDSYHADYDFYRMISEAVRIPVYIDDNKRIDYPSGVVLNGGINADELNYPLRSGISYLLGAQYIFLRKEFRGVSEKNIIKREISEVMITFGGDDSKRMTSKILSVLIKHYPKVIKNVIIGKGFKNIKELEKLKDAGTNLIYYPDGNGMKKVMLDSDIAISAGGQTLYELARVGVPTIAIATADNQLNNIEGLKKAGFIEYAGWWEDEAVLQNIVKKIELLKDSALRDEMAEIGRSLVDGQGARRVVEEIIRLRSQ